MAGRFYVKRASITASIAAVEGTFDDTDVAAADCVINAYDITVTPEVTMHDRSPSRGLILSRSASVPGARRATISFATDIKGSGTAGTAPAVGRFLRACANAATNTPATSDVYQTDDTAQECLNIAVNEPAGDGTYRSFRLGGAKGNCVISAPAGGGPLRATFTFMGKWFGTGAAGVTDPTAGIVDGSGYATGDSAWETTLPPTLLGGTFTLPDSASAAIPCISEVEIDMGNQVVVLPCATDATGYRNADIVAKNGTLRVTALASLAATFNPYKTWIAGTNVALNLVAGATAGNIVTITAPKVQVVGCSQVVIDGVYYDQLDCALNAPENDGSDDYHSLKIAFT